MKIELRWQLLLAAVCVTFLVSLLGFQIQTAGQCSTRIPSSGGRLIEGMIGQPQHLNPLLSESNLVDAELVDLLFDGLTRYDENGFLKPALARSWDISDDGLTYSFELRDDVLWHDGEPLTASDVVFTFSLLQDDNFPAPDSLQAFWSTVTISSTDSIHVDFVLPQPYSPFLDATTRGILPGHLLDRVPPSELADHSFNRSPIGTGPFMVIPGSDYQRDGYLRMAPYPSYWRGGTELDGLEFRFYPDGQSLVDAFEEGEIHSVTSFPGSDIDMLGSLEGIRLYTSAVPKYTQLIFNFNESASEAMRQLEMRRALVHSIDRGALIDQALMGQGLPLDGPYLPDTWAYSSDLAASFLYQPDEAGANLDAAGWTLPEGGSPIRERNGERLEIRLLTDDSPDHLAVAKNVIEQWGAIGIEGTLVKVDGAELSTALGQGEFDVALVVVKPITDPDLYDFWSQEAIVRGQNFGGWNNRRASEALEEGRKLSSPDERRPYYSEFLRYYGEDLPAMTLYQHVRTYGISESVNEVDIGKIDSPRERFNTFAKWFVLFREISTACPEVET